MTRAQCPRMSMAPFTKQIHRYLLEYSTMAIDEIFMIPTILDGLNATGMLPQRRTEELFVRGLFLMGLVGIIKFKTQIPLHEKLSNIFCEAGISHIYCITLTGITYYQ